MMVFLIPILLLFSAHLTSAATSTPFNTPTVPPFPQKGIGRAVPLSGTSSHTPKPNKAIASAFLQAHNALRAGYGLSPLKWDKKLARFARRWANKMHYTCDLTHSHGPYGENLFRGEGDWTIAQAMEKWSEEVESYDWMSNTCAPRKMCGHFTQMIWSGTKRVGCGMARCNATHIFISCNYEPGGNYVGHRPIVDYEKYADKKKII